MPEQAERSLPGGPAPAFRRALFVFVATVAFPVSLDAPANPDVYKAPYAAIGALVLFGWLLVDTERRRAAIRLPASLWPVMLILAWAALGLVWAHDRYAGVEMLVRWTAGVLVAVLVCQLAIHARYTVRLYAWLLASGTAVAGLALLQAYASVEWVAQGPARPAGTFANKNFMMHYLVVVVPLGACLWLTSRSHAHAWICAIATALVVAVFFHTLTRAAFAALAVEAVAFGVYLWRLRAGERVSADRPGRGASAIGAAVIVLVLANFDAGGMRPAVPLLWDRFVSETGGDMEAIGAVPEPRRSVDGTDAASAPLVPPRWLMWSDSVRMVRAHPWLGVGLGNWHVYQPRYSDRAEDRDAIFYSYHAHNSWLEAAAMLGVPGVLLAVWVVIAVSRMTFAAARADGNGATLQVCAGIALAGMGVNALFSAVLEHPVPLVAGGVCLGVLAAGEEGRNGRIVRLEPRRTAMPAALGCLLLAVAVLEVGRARVVEERAVARAYQLGASGRWQLAADSAQRAIDAAPFSVRAYALRAVAEISLGQAAAAERSVTRFLTKNPHNYAAHVFRARSLAQSARYDEAIIVLRQCLLMRPSDAETRKELQRLEALRQAPQGAAAQ